MSDDEFKTDRLSSLLDEDEPEEEETSSPLDEDDEIETLPNFDLERLLIEGKNAVVTREIEFYDPTDGKKKKMPVTVRPLTRGERGRIDTAIAKKKKKGDKKTDKNLTDLIASIAWLDEDGIPFDISVIRRMPDGVVKNVVDEIKFVSGEFQDRFEDKAIKELFGTD